jgi:hypothetical protein
MTPIQKQITQELLDLSCDHGFHYFPLTPIAAKLGITEVLYDNNTNTGLLWDLGKFGKGYIDVHEDRSACINRDLLRHIENQL